jgi:hypothetical protein
MMKPEVDSLIYPCMIQLIKKYFMYMCVKRAFSSIKHSVHGQIGGQFPAYLLI